MPPADPAKPRKPDARFIGDVPGAFALLDRRGEAWEGRSYGFLARSVSTARATITTDLVTIKGEQVALRFDGIGIRRGRIERVLKDGFIVAFDDEGVPVADLGARIDWLNRKTRQRAEDRRRHKRVLPRIPDAILVLGAHDRIGCRIIDMSMSGVAVRAAAQPPVGQLLAVGAIAGRVARHFDGGFAIQFLELQDLEHLEAMLTLRSRVEKSIAARRLGTAA